MTTTEKDGRLSSIVPTTADAIMKSPIMLIARRTLLDGRDRDNPSAASSSPVSKTAVGKASHWIAAVDTAEPWMLRAWRSKSG
jgi:hypothetical protein